MSYFRKRSVLFNFDPFRQIVAGWIIGVNSVTFSKIKQGFGLRHGRLLDSLLSLLPLLVLALSVFVVAQDYDLNNSNIA